MSDRGKPCKAPNHYDDGCDRCLKPGEECPGSAAEGIVVTSSTPKKKGKPAKFTFRMEDALDMIQQIATVFVEAEETPKEGEKLGQWNLVLTRIGSGWSFEGLDPNGEKQVEGMGLDNVNAALKAALLKLAGHTKKVWVVVKQTDPTTKALKVTNSFSEPVRPPKAIQTYVVTIYGIVGSDEKSRKQSIEFKATSIQDAVAQFKKVEDDYPDGMTKVVQLKGGKASYDIRKVR